MIAMTIFIDLFSLPPDRAADQADATKRRPQWKVLPAAAAPRDC
jgi:hypothetical protein